MRTLQAPGWGPHTHTQIRVHPCSQVTHVHRSTHTQHMQSHQCAPDTEHTYASVHEAHLKHADMYTLTHAHKHTGSCMHMYGLIHMYAHTCKHACTRTHAHTHAHPHTHTPESLSAPHRASCHSSEKAKETGPGGHHVLDESLTWPC